MRFELNWIFDHEWMTNSCYSNVNALQWFSELQISPRVTGWIIHSAFTYTFTYWRTWKFSWNFVLNFEIQMTFLMITARCSRWISTWKYSQLCIKHIAQQWFKFFWKFSYGISNNFRSYFSKVWRTKHLNQLLDRLPICKNDKWINPSNPSISFLINKIFHGIIIVKHNFMAVFNRVDWESMPETVFNWLVYLRSIYFQYRPPMSGFWRTWIIREYSNRWFYMVTFYPLKVRLAFSKNIK